MPRRDEEKRIAFLRTLAVEDLANRRITEHSSELEKRMVHDARDAMKEKNDARYMARHKKKAAVDIVKTQINGVGRRAQAEVFGREGGLTGGMVGSWLIGGTLAAGTIAGIMSRGKFGRARQGIKGIGRMTRQRIKFLNNAHLSDKDTDRFISILKRAKTGNLSREDRMWIQKRTVSYKNKAKNSLPFMKDHKNKSGNPNPTAKVEKPAPTNTPVTQPAQKVGDPKRANPNLTAMGEPQKEVLSKLVKGRRLTKEDYAVLRQLKTEGKLSKTHQSLLSARIRVAKANRKLKASRQTKPVTPEPVVPEPAKQVAQQPVAVTAAPPKPAPAPPPVQTVAAPAPPPIVISKIEVAGKHSAETLQSMLSKGGTMPKDFPAYPDAVQQLRKTYKTPALSLTKDGNYAEQVNEFASAIAEVAKKSPLTDQENVCLLLSHKVVQANRPIENFGRTLYEKALAMLNGGTDIKKKSNAVNILLPPVRLERKPRLDKERARRLLKLHTRPTTDLSPETKRLLREAKANNFGKPVKPVVVPKKTQRQEYQEAKARLMDTTPSKREQKLINGYEQRAAELEKAGNNTEAALHREHADMVRRNGAAIREVFAENIARHEKEISANLSKPLETIRAERKANEAARVEKMRAIMNKKRATMEKNRNGLE